MGGAGTWHLGLRHPDKFAVMQPGAGFTTTHGYIAKLPETLPDYQEKCLRIYDAYRYAENAFDIPIVAYSGEIDAQRKAAENIQAELKRLGLGDRMTHLIGPGLAHSFPPEWQRRSRRIEEVRGSREAAAEVSRSNVRFVTYTLKTNRCDWLELLALDKHYERAFVDGQWDGSTFKISTTNVAQFGVRTPPKVAFPKTVTIDGKAVDCSVAGRWSCEFSKDQTGWKAVRRDANAERTGKRPLVQGPIDDAFTNSFVCVVGTGKPNNPAMHDAAVAQLDRFRREWDKYMRGILPVKKDTEVNDEDMKNKKPHPLRRPRQQLAHRQGHEQVATSVDPRVASIWRQRIRRRHAPANLDSAQSIRP